MSAPRIATLDAVRGAAVMGILLLNIIDFAMPGYAYVDPHFYGGASGANRLAWQIVYVLADGKMRGLFTMLFGAGTVLIAEAALNRGERPARIHYARMASLFAIGMAHAYLLWSGDILVLYAVTGALVFMAWRWRVRMLLAVGIALLALKLAAGLIDYHDALSFQAAAARPDAGAALQADWRRYVAGWAPTAQDRAAELAADRGSYADAFAARLPVTAWMQTGAAAQALPDTAALMLIGMALFRLGFFSGAWPRRRYRQVAIAGYAVCLPLYLPIVRWIEATRFSPVTLLATDAIHLTLLRPWLSLAHAAIVILFVQSGALPWLAARLSAAGRMAFSNYLGTSLLCSLLFDGYGWGWFGYLQRWQCYPVVAGVWVLMLLWSKPWLDRFRYGPFEWAWRSLARGRRQPMRQTSAVATDAQ